MPLKVETEWFRIGEREPRLGRNVLVLLTDNRSFICFYSEEQFHILDTYEVIPLEYVYAWTYMEDVVGMVIHSRYDSRSFCKS